MIMPVEVKQTLRLMQLNPEAADLMGFSRTIVSRVYTEWNGKHKISAVGNTLLIRGQKPDRSELTQRLQ